ncbi:hypothetical protein BDK51DRAFT_29374 [Blyttiomyces helicus]|uniref:Uncharacterized protein n=1 Tax=Blyttiomyces helicus TaxID=388810 RepID=A0A4P9WC51_9FUNG|nr:hypothetical protein BDK51DRAFT_29374 [Blyttiomyces helicus]|eukprot:RKO89882.1 hypothetical protein BDK51DRAFT_29374 [Blyttiomyces helicus]
MRPETCSFIVGIDPGTTFSGVSIGIGSFRHRLEYRDERDRALGVNGPPRLNENNLFIIRKFKLLMQPGAANEVNVEVPPGVDPIDIMARFLASLRNEAMRQIRAAFGDHVRDEAVYWCTTIPADVPGSRSVDIGLLYPSHLVGCRKT